MIRSPHNQPVDSLYETELQIFNETHSIETMRQPFMGTEPARLLASNEPRFLRFAWEDADKFVKMFGADVDPFQHGPYQARTVAIPMMESIADDQDDFDLLSLTEAERHLFVGYHVLHDDHEGITGDVPYLDKTAESDAEELAVWDNMISDVYGDPKSRQLREFAAKCSDKKSESPLAKLWEVSEQVGYLATGMRAWELATQEQDLTLSERSRSLLMATTVVTYHLPHIEAMRDRVPYIDDMLMSANYDIVAVCATAGKTKEQIMKEAM